MDVEWAKNKKKLVEDLELEEKTKFVDFQNKVTQQFWENETQAFHDNLKTKLEEEHTARHRAFDEHMERVATQNPESAEAYHLYVFTRPVLVFLTNSSFTCSRLSTAGATLNNLCDVLGKQYGMNMSIFLCGLIGAREGRIEMRRYVYV